MRSKNCVLLLPALFVFIDGRSAIGGEACGVVDGVVLSSPRIAENARGLEWNYAPTPYCGDYVKKALTEAR